MCHLTITVSQTEPYGRKSSFFHTPLHSTPPLKGSPSEQRHPVWHAKTRMDWLPDGEKISKISLFVLAQLTNVTDRQTPGVGNIRAMQGRGQGGLGQAPPPKRDTLASSLALCIAWHGNKNKKYILSNSESATLPNATFFISPCIRRPR